MRKKTKPSKRRSSAEWSRLVNEWHQSELDAAVFAKERRVKPGTLKWWAWRLEGSQPSNDERHDALRLVPVEVTEPAMSGLAEWAVELRGGTVLRVRGELSVSVLRAILELGGTSEVSR